MANEAQRMVKEKGLIRFQGLIGVVLADLKPFGKSLLSSLGEANGGYDQPDHHQSGTKAR